MVHYGSLWFIMVHYGFVVMVQRKYNTSPSYIYAGSCNMYIIWRWKAQAWAADVWGTPICRLIKLKTFRTTVELILIYGCYLWSKRVMMQSHDQPRTVRLPPTDRHHQQTKASSSGRSGYAPWWCRQQGPALEARWLSKSRPTNKTSARHHIEDSKLSGTNMLTAMKNRNHWKEIITSPR